MAEPVSAASTCAKCGACSVVCPVYRVSGNEAHIARGKLHLLDVLGLHEAGKEFVDIFSACLLCGACSAVCSRNIDITAELVQARSAFSSHAGPHGYEKYLLRKLLDSPAGLKGSGVFGRTAENLLASRLPKDSGLRIRLALFAGEGSAPVKKTTPEEIVGKRLNWFPGCTTQYLLPNVASSCEQLLAGYGFSLLAAEGLACCGLAAWAAGDMESAKKSGRKNIRAFESTEGDILVSCASCFVHLQHYPELFAGDREWASRARSMAGRLREISAFLAELGTDRQEGKTTRYRVFCHDPCHVRFGAAGTDQNRKLLQETGRAEILELADGPRCCGQGGLFHLAYPEIAGEVRDQLVADVLDLQPDVVTTSCSGCLMQWRQGLAAAGSDVKAVHLADLLKQLQ